MNLIQKITNKLKKITHWCCGIGLCNLDKCKCKCHEASSKPSNKGGIWNWIMYFYACPYCDPCKEARLIKIIAKNIDCKYEKEEACEGRHKCKEVMRCQKCKEEWTYSLKFLREQKRKIKDG